MVYTITEALRFLRKEYGAQNMPTSEETLRRAVRSGQLRVQEDSDPGRKGYTIREEDLRQYAQNRMDRIRRRMSAPERPPAGGGNFLQDAVPLSFPELCSQRMAGTLSSEKYYLQLFSEKMKWEALIARKQEQLKQLEVQMQVLKSEVVSCQSAIDAYSDGIAKYIT